ncbi:DUF1501 domain-containing protein [Lignipirellula cremea]|uniref:Sulfatase n=1 Tax=Lignipirellula cremea TaxID=2528010 RepID=A0A518DML0_9BACT|nr:DUF1501 domain-containing protein [Lignipirellula cremea]QDU93076.1 hypothetical protein Pla8534_08540 [Lignipirellula cremea]
MSLLLPHLSRREMLTQAGAGFGALALSALLGQTARSDERAASPQPHHRPRAKNVIFLFMEGGPSAIDLFDPKPKIEELAGKPLPASFGPVITPMGEYDAPLLPSQRSWKQYGQSGTWVSDWLPHTAECVDDIAVIRSCYGEGLNHSNGVCQMNTGSILGGRPSLGAWVTYGLATENDNLPAFVVINNDGGKPTNGPRNWSAGFMPALYQGAELQSGPVPIKNLANPPGVSQQQQRSKLDLLHELNQQHAGPRSQQTELEARIRSYELAFRMQAEAPEAIDLESETADTFALYGLDDQATQSFGRDCLLARRLVERGVRFVQLYHGAGSKWDAHNNIEKNHGGLCKASDKPIAGLLKDLKRRGLLQDTLVIWGGEFGRTPMSEKGNGRDHNPYGFTMWMAGGGVRGGQTIGATDEIGLHAIDNRLHIHDLHATILWLLGLNHMDLIYYHKGRPERPTLNEGEPYTRIAT